jgi:hypothetical protein
VNNDATSKWKATHMKAVASVDGENFFDVGVTLMVLEGLSLSMRTHFKDLFIEMISQAEGKENNLMLLTEAEMTSVGVAKLEFSGENNRS